MVRTCPAANMLCRMQEQNAERSRWERDREALEQQVANTRTEWQGKLDKALAEAQHQRQATTKTASLATAAQQQADLLQQSLE